MTVQETIEILQQYPGTMELVIEMVYNERDDKGDEFSQLLHYDIKEMQEDDKAPNTITIKI